jgi:hypothetical protein
MKRNMRTGGIAATEVYRIDGETAEGQLYFDVYSIKQWCHQNLSIVGTWVNWERADQLVRSGAVDPERIKEYSFLNLNEPVIIGINGHGDGNDALLDGAHRYVAAALAATAAGMTGGRVPLPAYFLEPDQWRQFLIPRFVAVAMGFEENHDRDGHRWPEAVSLGA